MAKHNLYRFIRNGGERVVPKYIGAADTLADIWSHFDSPSIKFKEVNIFYQVNPTEGTKKGSQKDVINVVAIPVDIDGFTNQEDIELCEKEVVKFLERANVESFITINSGNGLHIIIRTGTQRADYIETHKARIIATIGVQIDSIANQFNAHWDNKVLEAARLLRVPFTINKKEGKAEKHSFVITNRWDETNDNVAFIKTVNEALINKSASDLAVDNTTIIKAFADELGVKWSKGCGYSFLEHPERGNTNNLALYDKAKWFFNFSDKDDKNTYSLEEVWNWHKSGKPYPFKVGKNDTTDIILEFVKKYHKIRYADANGNKIVEDVNGNPAYINESAYKSLLKRQDFDEYIKTLGLPPSIIQKANYSYKSLLNILPQSKYDAEPIERELQQEIAVLQSMWTMKFDYLDNEIRRNLKASIFELIKADEYEVLSQKGVMNNGMEFCVNFNTIIRLFGDTKKLYSSEYDFLKALRWCGVKISDNRGAICYRNNNNIEMAYEN